MEQILKTIDEAAKKEAVVALGAPVRCIDCVGRKTCGFVRINKYKSKPCTKYFADLGKQSHKNSRR